MALIGVMSIEISRSFKNKASSAVSGPTREVIGKYYGNPDNGAGRTPHLETMI